MSTLSALYMSQSKTSISDRHLASCVSQTFYMYLCTHVHVCDRQTYRQTYTDTALMHIPFVYFLQQHNVMASDNKKGGSL